MTEEELNDLRHRITIADHDTDAIKAINAEFIETQKYFLIEEDKEKDITINARIRTALNSGKPKEAANLMRNQISKWIRRISDDRAGQVS